MLVDIGVVRGGEGGVVCVFCSLWSLVEFGTDGLKGCPGLGPEDDEFDWVRWTCRSAVYIFSSVQSLKESWIAVVWYQSTIIYLLTENALKDVKYKA